MTEPLPLPMVATRHGAIVGRSAGQVQVFKGVPYASPPVGPLRFCPPQPPKSWSAPFDAGIFGAAPMQPEEPRLGSVGAMSEDCLTLNIWAPATAGAAGPRPVLFWIYGGANIYGSSSQAMYDGQRYAEQGIVFVSANYRLGAFGFLELGSALPDFAGSSLNGLRDLIAALQWVRENIEAFGGDCAAVTLMGESAGAKNICALATSPLARGLFCRVAVLSGGGQTVYATQEEAAPFTRAFLEAASLAPDNAADVLTMPAQALISVQAAVMKGWPKGFPFRPTLDGEVLPARPVDAASSGATSHLDMIVGTCRDEGALSLPPARAGDRPFETHPLANIDLEVMLNLQSRYAAILPGMPAADRNVRQFTAEEYWIPSLRFIEAHVRAGGAAWMYRFDRAATAGPLKGYAHHGCDVPFIFDVPWPELGLFIPADEREFVRQIMSLWSRWARDGEAALEGAPPWPAYELRRRTTMLIAGDPSLEDDPHGAERALWDGIL